MKIRIASLRSRSLVLLGLMGTSPLARAQSTPPPTGSAGAAAALPTEAAPAAAPAPPATPASPPHTLESSGLDPALKPVGSTSSQPPAPAPLAVHVQEYPPSLEAPPELFGTQGTLVITGAFTVSAGVLGHTESDQTEFSLRMIPSIDYFVAQNFSVGGALVLAYDDNDRGLASTKSTNVGITLGTGYNVPLGKVFSWWPKLSLGTIWTHSRFEAALPYQGAPVLADAQDEVWLAAGVYLPLLIHPTKHFFVGVGPDAFVDIVDMTGSSEDRLFRIAVSSVVGGWF